MKETDRHRETGIVGTVNQPEANTNPVGVISLDTIFGGGETCVILENRIPPYPNALDRQGPEALTR